MDKADDQGRREERITINKEFESFDAFVQEYVTNISRTGAFIKSKKPLPLGTIVNLRFTVIMDDMETIEGVGEVVRIEEHHRSAADTGVYGRIELARRRGATQNLRVFRAERHQHHPLERLVRGEK
jgi:hypothetical protein